jgi:hypothetical protein
MYWAVDLDDDLHGPFPNSKAGREEAMRTLAGEEPYTFMGGWSHPGFLPRHPLPEVVAIAAVTPEPPDDLPVDLFPKPGARFSRSQVQWMRDRVFGTAYRTRLIIRGEAIPLDDPDPFLEDAPEPLLQWSPKDPDR